MAEKSKILQPMDSWGARKERKVVVYVIYMIRYIPSIEGVKKNRAQNFAKKIFAQNFAKNFAKNFALAIFLAKKCG